MKTRAVLRGIVEHGLPSAGSTRNNANMNRLRQISGANLALHGVRCLVARERAG
jgi:hypothetical protein